MAKQLAATKWTISMECTTRHARVYHKIWRQFFVVVVSINFLNQIDWCNDNFVCTILFGFNRNLLVQVKWMCWHSLHFLKQYYLKILIFDPFRQSDEMIRRKSKFLLFVANEIKFKWRSNEQEIRSSGESKMKKKIRILNLIGVSGLHRIVILTILLYVHICQRMVIKSCY